MKRRTDGTIDLDGLDPRVAEEVHSASLRAKTRGMSKPQRKQAARNRMTFDLPVDLEQELTTVANRLSVPISQVAIWWMLRGREVTNEGEMIDARIPSRSMRYEFVLFPSHGDTKRRR